MKVEESPSPEEIEAGKARVWAERRKRLAAGRMVHRRLLDGDETERKPGIYRVGRDVEAAADDAGDD